jgi:hypothetical protein
MSNPVTKQQLIDAGTDSQTFSDVMNSQADSVTTRTGATLPTMKKALQLATGPIGPQGTQGVRGPQGPAATDVGTPINILDYSLVVPGTVNAVDGTFATANWAYNTPLMDLRGATQWCANFPVMSFVDASLGVAYYNSAGVFLSGFMNGDTPWAAANVFNVPVGAVFMRLFFQAAYNDPSQMVLAGPVVPDVFQAFDPDSRYGGGGVLPGTQLSLAFYKHTGATLTHTAMTTDPTGVHLNVPGNAAAATDTRDMTFVQPSGDVGGSGATSIMQRRTTGSIQGPGRNFGNAGEWTTGFADSAELAVAQRGIHQLRSGTIQKHAVGDTAGLYTYTKSDGGIQAASDEGVTGATIHVQENFSYFHGTVVSSTGVVGDTHPVFTKTSGNPWTTDGAFMLNLSKGVYSGNMLSPSVPCAFTTHAGVTSSFLPGALPVTANCLPISEAIGITTVSPIAPFNTFTVDDPQQVDVIVQLVQIGGVYPVFTVGSHVSVAGSNYPEQAKLLAVVDHHDGTMTLTMKLRNPNLNAVIFQGGIAGQYISFGANVRFSGYRSSYFAFGSLTGSDLIYGLQVGGGIESAFTLPQQNQEAARADGGASSDFNLYPGAEIVANGDQGIDCTLEQNNVLWAPGDSVENPHFPVFGGTGLWVTRIQETPSNARAGQIGFALDVGGHGFGGGNVALIRAQNTNPPEYYEAAGGPITAPGGILLTGNFATPFHSQRAPQSNGAVVFVAQPAADGITPEIIVISINYAGGGNLFMDPATGTWRVDGNLRAGGFKSSDGSPGVTGSFLTAGGATVTVKNGLIVGIA